MKNSSESTLKEEIKKGLGETRDYILSHHKPEEYYRCYSFPFQERSIHLCARCTGIYPGIFLMIYLILNGTYLNILTTAILPFPSIIEKYFTGKSKRKGYNSIRTLTGFLLGISYVNGAYLFVKDPLNPALIGIGLIYFMIAGLLIGREI